MPISGITVKIAAIEQRSNFQIALNNNNYIGIELGADAAADINLDDFMVFDNDAERARHFFQELIYRHFVATEEIDRDELNSEQLIQSAFTQQNVFDEFVDQRKVSLGMRSISLA